MYIRVASDLHLETRNAFSMNTLLPPDEKDKESILVLAGDISSNKDQLEFFLNHIQQRFYAVVYVPGNHEFYGHDIEEWVVDMDKRLSENCLIYAALAEVRSFMISNVRFICGTLWGDGCDNEFDARRLEAQINDFKYMKDWNHDSMVAVNRSHRQDIERLLKEPFDGKTVVVTHHLPSHSLCAPRFGYKMNGAFASDCDALMKGECAPWLWVFGHSHDTSDRMLGNTRVICNPAGYPEDSKSEFNKYGKVFIPL